MNNDNDKLDDTYVVLLSGGVDSAAALHFIKKQGVAVEGIFVDYGQTAAIQEQEAAHRVASWHGVKLSTIKIMGMPSYGNGEIVGRNAYLVMSAMMARPYANNFVLGIHTGPVYYDVSSRFVSDMQQLLDGYTSGSAQLHTPFICWQKNDIVAYLKSINMPLSITYSCEIGGATPCGRCLSCVDRSRYECTT